MYTIFKKITNQQITAKQERVKPWPKPINENDYEKLELLNMAFKALKKLKEIYATEYIRLQFYNEYYDGAFINAKDNEEEILITLFSNKNRMKEVCERILNY